MVRSEFSGPHPTRHVDSSRVSRFPKLLGPATGRSQAKFCGMGYVFSGMVSPEPGPESEAATELTRGGAQLRESELYALAFASISDGLIVTDGAGRILLFNAEAERLLGQSLGGTSVRSWSELAEAFLPEG